MALKEETEFGTARQMIESDEAFSHQEKEQLKKIDLACGMKKQEGFIGFDRSPEEGVDIVHDLLTFPWPIESDSVYEFFCSHFVEHIPHQLMRVMCGSNGEPLYRENIHKDGLVLFMEEVYRCLQPLGTIRILAPYYTSVRCWQDPTHVRAITDVTFSYFSKKHAHSMGVSHYTGICDFEVISRKFILNPEWEGKSEDAVQWAMKHYFNVIDDIEIVLRALK